MPRAILIILVIVVVVLIALRFARRGKQDGGPRD